MKNVPVIKIGIVAVSRDCFPESLAVNRRKAVIAKYEEKFGKDGIYECPITIVESEIHAQQALEDVKKAGCNALCVYLGNFGPEISETMIADWFQGGDSEGSDRRSWRRILRYAECQPGPEPAQDSRLYP